MELKHCVIIGGGITGLVAANRLQENGFEVTVLDKGRGIGGRLATRRFDADKSGEGVFDYGAQYITVRDEHFKRVMNQWLQSGIVTEWSRGFMSESGVFKEDGIPRYRGVQSNRAIAKHLSQNLKIQTSTRVVRLAYRKFWNVYTENDEVFTGDCILLTPPVPQILSLLQESRIALSNEIETRLLSVAYNPCLALMVLLKNESMIPAPGGMWMDGEPVAWIADNHRKGISPNGYAVTIHAGPEFSRQNIDKDESQIVRALLEKAKPYLKSEITAYQLHRWRYSQASHTYGTYLEQINRPGPLFLAGDGFGGPRVEKAVLSGQKVAEAIILNLTSIGRHTF